MRLLELPDPLKLRRQFTVWDDFAWSISPHLWTVTATDAGAMAQTDAANGVITLTASDGTVADNDEIYILTTKEVFLLADDKPATVEARLKWSEANVDDANVAFGMADAVAANTIIDDGGGIDANFSGFVIYKIDGEQVWRVLSSIGATRTVTVTNKVSTRTTFQSLRIEFRPLGSTLGEVYFFLDNGDGTGWEQLKDANGVLIRHTVDMTSATEMQVWAGIKNGGANNEVLSIDYIGATALR
jgi:hypothetical protein